MGYKVIVKFKDLKDRNRIYEVGDEFPATERTVSEKRLEELLGDSNKIGEQLIRKEENEDSDKPLGQLTKDEIKAKLDEHGITYSNENKDDLYELLKKAIEERGEGGEE